MAVYLVSSLMRWPSSGRMSFSMARRTAFSEPGVEKRTQPVNDASCGASHDGR